VEEAEEIAQAAWVRGWEYRVQLRDPSLVGYWVNSIARNLFRARFRGAQTTTLEGLDPSSLPAYHMDLEQQLDLKRMLGRCGKRDRALLEQSLYGYTAEEMAHSEGITPTGIRVRLMRVRNSLRQQLAAAA
jgi:DNA-directed RNA polymerase specialized sigma24 family protein